MLDLFGQDLSASTTAPSGILVGCAGWSLSSTVASQFAGEGSHLERYARVLPAVEINSSFYRPHRASTYARWRDTVPATFRFSVKLPREITHIRRLHDIGQEIDVFLDAASNLGDRFGCLLVQMPPSLGFDAGDATGLFTRLRERLDIPIACEARHQGWFRADAAELLGRFDIARVEADPQVAVEAAPALYQGVVYVRLHGSPVIYHSDYAADYLKENAARLIAQHRQGRQVWCIFDNTLSSTYIAQTLFTLDTVKKGLSTREK